jgi:hypothetical protein
MAAVFAEKDVKDLLRDMKRGEATAASAKELADSDAKRKDAESRVGTAVDNMSNKLLTVLNDVLTPIIEEAAKAIETIQKVLEFFFGKAPPVDPEAVGVAGMQADIMAQAARLDRAGQDLLNIARNAGRGGVAAPAGAMPVGRGL